MHVMPLNSTMLIYINHANMNDDSIDNNINNNSIGRSLRRENVNKENQETKDCIISGAPCQVSHLLRIRWMTFGFKNFFSTMDT